MKKTNEIAAHFHPARNAWTGFAVQMGTPGSHENYNVVYNGVCNREYFATEEPAKVKAFHELKAATRKQPA